MAREFTDEEAQRHNDLTARGWSLAEGLLLTGETEISGPPNRAARKKLAGAAKAFRESIEINPEGWSSMWALGKIHQRLGDHAESLAWFRRARDINPEHPDVAREAGLAALDCGDGPRAVELCAAASELQPDDPGLLANLALAHVIAGDDAAATEAAQEAARRDPDDETSRHVLDFVLAVAMGAQERPANLREAFPD